MAAKPSPKSQWGLKDAITRRHRDGEAALCPTRWQRPIWVKFWSPLSRTAAALSTAGWSHGSTGWMERFRSLNIALDGSAARDLSIISSAGFNSPLASCRIWAEHAAA